MFLRNMEAHSATGERFIMDFSMVPFSLNHVPQSGQKIKIPKYQVPTDKLEMK